ncbi:hypothetical protein K9M59_04465 [Candidatus Gracilibacteria bacterium]|nr:hypothetical protein [Candidatus Gracilibacteria bacterium]MCF7819573.1 hypothetical protein [Candidatus Gracilibacteria bacterium]
MNKFSLAFGLLSLLAPFLLVEAQEENLIAIKRNVVTREDAETQRQTRQMRFGVRAFRFRGSVEDRLHLQDEDEVSPRETLIYGPDRLRIGIKRDRSLWRNNRSQFQERQEGFTTSRRFSGRRYGTTSYKKQVRDIKGDEQTSLQEMRRSYLRQKNNRPDAYG